MDIYYAKYYGKEMISWGKKIKIRFKEKNEKGESKKEENYIEKRVKRP